MAAARNKRVVIKLGTGVLTRGVGELDTERMRAICEQIALALKNGWQPILVSSGAVGLGMGRLGLKLRPKKNKFRAKMRRRRTGNPHTDLGGTIPTV